MTTVDALVDRIFADALAASLRASDAFCGVRSEVVWDTIHPDETGVGGFNVDVYVRTRAESHRRELSATAAETESALVIAHEQWQKYSVGKSGRPSEGPIRVVSLLALAASSVLQGNGREMILRVYRKEPGREILRWRFMSLALPASILTSAVARAVSRLRVR